jgi:hypothetical protein
MSRDKATDALIDVLKLALAGPSEQRLFKSGKLEGLFSGRTGINAEAAARALRDGLLEVVRTETRGKSTFDWVRLTPRGVEFLAESESPVCALEDLRDVLKVNRAAVPAWVEEMRQGMRLLTDNLEQRALAWLEKLEGLSRRVEDALSRLAKAKAVLPDEVLARVPWAPEALEYLDQRQQSGAPAACLFPELFAALRRSREDLNVSVFHDGLRHLQERRALRLLPMDDTEALTQPEFALFDGGRVLFAVAV